MIFEQQDQLFHRFQHFLLIQKQFVDGLTVCHFFAPATAQIDAVTVDVLIGHVEGALAHAATAMFAALGIDGNFAVFQMCNVYGTGLFQLAHLAAPALFPIHHRNALTHDTYIVQIGLNAVIGTAANSNFELMGQRQGAVTLIKLFMNLFRQTVGVDQTKLAGGTLAGHHRTDLFAGAAGDKAKLRQILLHGLDILIRNALNFNGKTGGHSRFSRAEPLGSFGNRRHFFCGDLTVDGNHPEIKAIFRPLIPQTAHALDPGYFFGRQRAANFIGIHRADGCILMDFHKRPPVVSFSIIFVLV